MAVCEWVGCCWAVSVTRGGWVVRRGGRGGRELFGIAGVLPGRVDSEHVRWVAV